MRNTAIDEKPILTTSFKTTQRGRAFSRSAFTPPGGITAKFSDGVFKRGARDACYQKGSLLLQKKKKIQTGELITKRFPTNEPR